MSDNVVAFAPREPSDPHISGEACCLGCRHQWVAVAPVGTAWLECPSCGLNKGTWKAPIEASPGDEEFTCSHCGGIALTAVKRGRLFYLWCMGCGIDHTSSVFGD